MADGLPVSEESSDHDSENFKTVVAFINEYCGGSPSEDHTLAIVSVAQLEWQVRGAVEHCFHAKDKPAKLLLGSDSSGGELSFTHQCRLAYCLGLFGEKTLADLELLAQIRNKFAHSGGNIDSFSDPVIEKLCKKLQTPDSDPFPPDEYDDGYLINPALKTHGGDPKKLFCFTIFCMEYRLHHECGWKKEQGRGSPPFLKH